MNPNPLLELPATDPANLYRQRDAICAVELLTVGLVHLDLFSWLDAKPSGEEAICQSLGLAGRPADVMLTLFAAMGLLERRDGIFRVTEAAREHLVKGSPWYLAPYYAFLKDRPGCKDLLAVLQTGKPASWASLKDEKAWAEAMESEEFSAQFTAAMDCRGVFLGPALAKSLSFHGFKRLLDVAGGSGIYACSVVARHPHMQAAVFEKPPVDRVAAGWISRRGFSGEVRVQSGDMFAEPLPAGFDVHLFSNVLHDWDVPKVMALLSKSHQALPPGGMVLVHDAHLNRDKTGPLPVAEYSVLLMHATEGRCYSIGEMEAYLEEAGFTGVTYIPTAGNRSLVTARKPGGKA
jgi:SAM-dependent methyltransferase